MKETENMTANGAENAAAATGNARIAAAAEAAKNAIGAQESAENAAAARMEAAQDAAPAGKRAAAASAAPAAGTDRTPAAGAAAPVRAMPPAADAESLTVRLLKKQLFWTRLLALACAALVLVALGSALVVVPHVNAAADTVTQTCTQINAVDWAAMAENIDQLAVTGQSQLAELDVESLNEAIANLQKTLAPLAKLFG